jgi:hypothetical protein
LASVRVTAPFDVIRGVSSRKLWPVNKGAE